MKKTLLYAFLLFPILLSAQLNWTLEDETFAAGDTVKAEFYVFDFDSITAYQMAMKFDTGALKFIGVEFAPDNPLSLNADDFGFYQLSKGILRHVWIDIFSRTLADGAHVFTYTFKAKQAGTLSGELWLSTCCLNPPMNPMAYRYMLQYMPLTLAYTSPAQITETTGAPESPDQFRIYPNPATDVLTVESDEPADIQIYNTLGQMTHRATGQRVEFYGLQPGVHFIHINNTTIKTVVKQ